MGNYIGKYISNNLSGKCSQNVHAHAKQSAPDALKITSKKSY